MKNQIFRMDTCRPAGGPFGIILVISFFVAALSAQQKGTSPLSSINQQLSTKNTFAVVVGISDYQDPAIPDLRFADKDAEAFANYLRSNAGGKLDNDHLKVLINQQATMAQFANALDWLWEVCKEGDQAIIYFSGHGDVEKKSLTQPGFLLCWDAPARVYMAGGAFALPMLQEVVSTLSIQNKAKVIVITDACRSGTLAGSSVGGSQATAANLAKQFGNEIKIMSCQPNEYSIEGEQWGGGRGAFSYHLLDALYGLADNNNDQWVTLQEIGRYLEDHVSNEVAPVSQVPMIVGNRNERLAGVDERLLASIKSGKTNQAVMLSAVESRGIEEDVLSKVDSSTRKIYSLFKNALKQKVFLPVPTAAGEPVSACADSYYEQLIKEPKLERLHSAMRRNYAAALQDDAQQVLNTALKSGLTSEILSEAKAANIYRNYPAYLDRAAELLGSGHYMYSALKARKHYFEGTLHTSIPEKKRHFFQALHWQVDMPHAYVGLIQQYPSELSDSAEFYAAKAMKLAPSWVKPYTELAKYYQKVKQQDKAEEILDQAGLVDSSSILVWYEKASFYGNRKNYSAAEHWYLKTISGAGEDICFPCAHLNLGSLYKDTNRFTEAEQHLKKAIQLDSASSKHHRSYCRPCAHSNLGLVYLYTGRMTEAEKQYERAIQIDSNFRVAFLNLGLVYLSNNRFADAEKQLKKAIQIDSSFADSYYNLGNNYTMTERYAEAEVAYKKAIQLDSNFITAHVQLGIVYFYTRHFAEAESSYKTALRIDSNFVFANFNMAVLHGILNQTEEAFYRLERAFKFGFNNYDFTQQNPAFAPLREQKDRWEALMQNAIVNDTADAKAWNMLGQVYIRASNYAPAEVAMRKAVALDATSAPFRSNLGFVYLNLGRYAEAEAALTRAIALDSAFANARKHLGMVCFKTNRSDEAKRHFLKAINLNPNYAGAMLGMACLLQSEGKTAEAIGYVEQAIGNGSAFEQLEKDEDLGPLRSTSEWKEFVKKSFPGKIKD